jgi:AraC-like DNA-binding protein
MLDPEASLAEISIELGFADQSHFSRAFRSITGTTPAAFGAMPAQHAITSRASQSLRPFLSSAGLHP